MPMKTGLMISGLPTEIGDRTVDVHGYFELLSDWGAQTLDIFPGTLATLTAAELRAALDDHGLACACYYIGADLNATGAEAEETCRQGFVEGIENALTLGAPIVFTHGTQHTYAGEDMFQRYTQRLGEMLPLVNDAGLTLVVENAGTLMHTVDDMLRLMDSLGDDGLRLCLDTGNFFLWGQDEVDAMRRAMGWTIHLHVKDYTDQRWIEPKTRPDAAHAILGQGEVRHAAILEILRAAGFDGVLALEPPWLDATEPGLRTLRDWLTE